MAQSVYRIQGFVGIDQSKTENLLSPVFSPDAMNMDTSMGELTVAKGYSKRLVAAIPGTGPINRIFLLRSTSGEIPVALADGGIYAYDYVSGSWQLKHSYDDSAMRGYDAVTVRIGLTDYLVIADGTHQLVKFDGITVTPFGSEEGCSNIPVNFVAMYRSRLFAAGDTANPNRLYYSQLPGGDRTIENWGYVEASPAVEGGHVEVGDTGGDPIVAITAMSNQLLIFKRNSIYRLIGDRPSNFTIERVETQLSTPIHTAVTMYRDVVYFVNREGLNYYNGVDAAPMPDARCIRRIMESASISSCRAAVAGNMLYFTFKTGGEDRMIEYDLTERRYMQRGGFNVSDIMTWNGRLMLVNSARHLYEFGTGDTYDGVPIAAYWSTPLTDLGDKSTIKAVRELSLRGNALTPLASVLTEVSVGNVRNVYSRLLPDSETDVTEIALVNEGRTLKLRFSNEGGGRFRLTGGIELLLAVRRRTE